MSINHRSVTHSDNSLMLLSHRNDPIHSPGCKMTLKSPIRSIGLLIANTLCLMSSNNATLPALSLFPYTTPTQHSKFFLVILLSSRIHLLLECFWDTLKVFVSQATISPPPFLSLAKTSHVSNSSLPHIHFILLFIVFLCFVSTSPIKVTLFFSTSFLMDMFFSPLPRPRIFQQRQFIYLIYITNNPCHILYLSFRFSPQISSLLDFLRPLRTAFSSVAEMPMVFAVCHVFWASLYLCDDDGEVTKYSQRSLFLFLGLPLGFFEWQLTLETRKDFRTTSCTAFAINGGWELGSQSKAKIQPEVSFTITGSTHTQSSKTSRL